ncbi:MAG: Fpg/Nei family DNA glycosylase [Propionibacteriales bacterium]|nr:Fpg/Nei family DNA glycosylase [Propionibacteriales bacterium]
MPEGHILHRLAADLTRSFAGGLVRSTSPQGRFATGAALLDGATLTGAEAFGKHLFVGFDHTAEMVHIHLGLYGGFTIADDRYLPLKGAVRWRLANGTTTADLRGPAVCELLAEPAVAAILRRLGPDPIRADAEPERAWHRILRSRSPIATLLMDQTVLAGVGNVYRAEVLFRQGIDPFLPGSALSRTEWDDIWADLVALMKAGVAAGRIDTVRPAHEPEVMGRPPRHDGHGGEVYVYRRASMECFICDTPVRTERLANRNLFWCPQCQPRR